MQIIGKMTQEDKELLLKDLCARLPYGTMVYAQNAVDWYDSEICTQVLSDVINEDYIVKPYLFPLASMTEEQKQYLKNRFCYDWDGEPYDLWKYQIEIGDTDELIDWLNKNHFDYRSLIPNGLAIDATGLNIYKEE